MTDSWRADGPADDEMSDRWRAVVSDTHLPWSTHVAPGPAFAAAVRRWWIDDLALVDVECAATSGSRGRSQIAATDGEFVALLFIRAGHEVIRTNGDTVRLTPGDAVVWDSTRTARFEVPGRLSKRSLLIPRASGPTSRRRQGRQPASCRSPDRGYLPCRWVRNHSRCTSIEVAKLAST